MEKMDKLEALLEFGIALLKKREINYWLDCGTLLGIVRDQNLLPWDTDLDIGIFKQDLSDSDIEYIVKKARNDCYDVNVYGSCISIAKKGYVFDIKLFDKIDGYALEKKLMPKNSFSSMIGFLVHCLSSEHGTNRKGKNFFNRIMIKFIQGFSKILPKFIKSILAKPLNYLYEAYLSKDISEAVPLHFFKEFEELSFNGRNYNIPVRSPDYLAFRYGKNWRSPDKDWVTERDDGAYLNNKEKNT